MNILLVNPPYIEDVYHTNRPYFLMGPLGLLYLGTYMKVKGIKTEILDANALRLSIDQTVSRILEKKFDVVGITCVTKTFPTAKKIAEKLKQRSNRTIIFGGPHVTFMAEEILQKCDSIDFIVKGEGEISLFELLMQLERGEEANLPDVKGIAFKVNGRVVDTGRRDLIKDLDLVPIPDRSLINSHLYFPSPIFNRGYKGKQYSTIITSRGCHENCSFCASRAFWGRIRIRKPENILEEMKYLISEFGVKHIDFLDDTFTLTKKRISDICTMILDEKMDVNWTCYSRVDSIDFQVAKLMKLSGCFGIQFGIESGNEKILKRINKNATKEDARYAVKCVRKAGIKVQGDFMIGLPGDTKETIMETFRFAKELKLNTVLFSITLPLPGTLLYEEASRAKAFDSTKYDIHKSEDKTITDIYRHIQRNYYLNADYAFRELKFCIKHPYEFINYFKLLILLKKFYY